MEPTKKYIFLDIDGVLASEESSNTDKSLWYNEFAYPFDSVCVHYLNEILNKSDADIILTSDWRKVYDLDELDLIFKFNKVIKSPVSVTKSVGDRNREIELYIQENSIDNFCILDDMELETFSGKFVRCISKSGITEKEYLKVLEIFN